MFAQCSTLKNDFERLNSNFRSYKLRDFIVMMIDMISEFLFNFF